ncbi:hypothetical protein JCM5353_006036 [Sporobolomyces roseus]
MLYPRQALYGTTAGASSAISSSISASTQNQGSSASDDKDSRSALWKYAIVVILAILALSTLFRLMFLRRARRMRQMQQEALGLRVAGRRGGTQWGGLQQQSEDRRRFSTDTVDLQERGYSGAPLESTEPPPPAYDDDRPTLAPLSSSIQPPPPVVQHRPSFLSRFSSRFKRTPSETSTPQTNLAPALGGGGTTNQPPRVDPNEDYFGISMRQASSTEATAQVLAEENQTNQRRGVTAIQRALSDAGLLVGRSRGLSRSESNGPRDIVNAAEAAQREREERRRVRRERRRERRRRERERDEGLGLPVYSKKKAEGEEVLQVAEGIKEDETDSEDDGSASEGENGEPSITPPSRPSTSQNVDPVTNTAEDPSAPPMVVTRPHPLA